MSLRRYGALAAAFALTLGAAPSYESMYLSVPSAAGAMETSRVINQRIHYPGTPGDYALARYMRDRLQAAGFDATIEPFTVDVFTPKLLQLELLSSPKTVFDLHETPMASDPDVSRPDAGIPFNSGSGSGDVTAPVVYVNRGLDDDYAALAKRGISVRGRIALVRYGAQFRGLLAHRAERNGAAGLILYSDPRDDGAQKGAVYPNGPYRPAGSVQRGSLGVPPLKIPSLPISAANAQKLLADLHGDVSASRVHVHVEMNVKPTVLWNTVGTLRGTDPSQSVVIGGHRDAWVYGVTDDGSGISTLIEIARGLGSIHARGWRPRRSIVIVGFDAEEIGELGSHAYGVKHAAQLRAGGIAYVNADEVTSGQRFGAGATAALADEIVDAAKTVPNPAAPSSTVYARWAAQQGGARVRTPGGGSDFETFIYDFGIPVVDAGFGGVLGGYHSAYDDFRFASKILDPGFVNHRAMAQVFGVLLMRLADAPALPYHFAGYADAFTRGLDDVTKTANAAHVSLSDADVQSLHQAIAALASAGTAADRNADSSRNASKLRAARRIDGVLYGRNGYAAVTLPLISAAIASGNASSVHDAVSHTRTAILDAVNDLR